MVYDSSLARIGVLGATGYTGRELLRLLVGHTQVAITFATSESEAGKPLRRLTRGAPNIELVKSEDAPLDQVDLVFSCLPHGDSARWVERVRAAGVRAIDLSADLRVPTADTPEWAREAVYGLPELHRERIRGSDLVANPGCYPTAATLALAPLLRRGMLGEGPIVINAASGVTGAGRSPKRELLFGEVGEDFRAYAVGNVHRHIPEMRSQAAFLAGGIAPDLVFTPHLLPVRRGILETICVPLAEELSTDAACGLYLEDYAEEPFVDVLTDRTPTLQDVVSTNLVAISVAPVAGLKQPMLLVVAAIDNLVKGAAGQAVQNLNLMYGWPETEALI
jgi:N-acetyl-gamma-glutamyl-phosphate reductase